MDNGPANNLSRNISGNVGGQEFIDRALIAAKEVMGTNNRKLISELKKQTDNDPLLEKVMDEQNVANNN